MAHDNSLEEQITGFVDHIVYRNEDNGYTVLVLDTDVTVTGLFPTVSEGDSLRLTGGFIFHETYGEQFNATSYEIEIPTSEDDIRRYLGSGAIKGIGPALARRIVDRFGEDTFRIMEQEPERLAEIKGISAGKAADISDAVVSKNRDRQAVLFLMKQGITNQMAAKIYRFYGNDVYYIMEQNPYKMADDIRGVGFKTADEIAGRMGISKDNLHRIKSGILFVLSQAAQAGHTFLPKESLESNSERLLGVSMEDITSTIMQLSIDGKIAVRGDRIYLMRYYRMEQDCSAMLKGLDMVISQDDKDVDRFLAARGSETEIELDELQLQAVYRAATHGVVVLTGGPGTGKTTTIRTIIDYFEYKGYRISLCAPTGRAAKRMTESTGREAMTIHRLLEVSSSIEDGEDPASAKVTFARGKNYPLETEAVIVDEASMVDISLFYNLLNAIPLETHLILVGDSDQLPSVGPGNVLRDIIDSERFSVVRLVNIFRQKERSDIVINAHKIQSEEPIILDNKSRDFFFMRRNDAAGLTGTLLSLVRDKLPPYVGATPYDIQILSPTRKGVIGVESLNKVLQSHLNPPASSKAEQSFGDRIFRVGDKVMQTKNNYRTPWRVTDKYGHVIEDGLGVYNGDMGRISAINKYAKFLEIEFDDGKRAEYAYNQIEEIDHAYAVTVHKSQGSEYPAVVIPLMNVPRMLMNRNLIYTAITRARKCVVLVGSEEIFRSMVNNDTILNRYSGLKDAICSGII